MSLLRDKSAIVTGGGRGIGRSIAEALAAEGASIVLVARTAHELQSAAATLGSHGAQAKILAADVTRPETAEQAARMCLDAFGTIDILVNAAGIVGPIGPVEGVDPADWRRALDVNLTAAFYFIQAVLPVMKSHRCGKIVNLSGGGAGNPRPMYAAYAASKAALVRLTETVAEEVKEFNIQVNAIAPGAVNTRMLDDMLAAGRKTGGEYDKLREQQKSGGVPPERAAALAVFLASNRSDGLTGRLISAVWDDWAAWTADDITRIQKSDLYTLRRMNAK